MVSVGGTTGVPTREQGTHRYDDDRPEGCRTDNQDDPRHPARISAGSVHRPLPSLVIRAGVPDSGPPR